MLNGFLQGVGRGTGRPYDLPFRVETRTLVCTSRLVAHAGRAGQRNMAPLSLSLTDSVACQPRPGTWRFVLIRPGQYDDDGAPVIACAAVSVMHSVSCARVQHSAHVHEEGAVLQQSA